MYGLQFAEVDHAASWQAAGLIDHFAAVHDDALMPAVFDAVESVAERLLRPDHPGGSKKIETESSFWMPLYEADGSRRAPLNALEAAAHQLHYLAFGDAPTPVIGGEWWLRGEDGDEADRGFRFHFDKDESHLKLRDEIRNPEVSSVTYLGMSGAPTLVLNQTIGHGANEMEPRLAPHGLLAHPHLNRHLIFRGDLNHGVVGPLARQTATERRRLVLLINWWRAPAPSEPRCMPMSEDAWRERGLLEQSSTAASTIAGAKAWMARRPPPSPPAAVTVPPPPAAQGRRHTWIVFEVGDGFVYQYALPHRESVDAEYSLVEWPAGTAIGPLLQMSPAGMPAVIADARPKLHLVLDGRPKLWAGLLPSWLPALHEQYGAALGFVLTVASEHAMLLRRFFGVRAQDAPTAALHNPAGNEKYAMGGQLNEAALREFVRDFLHGRLRTAKEDL